MTATMPPSPFLSGLMTPVTDERDDHDLEVTGSIPVGLSGMFVRNGPNPQFEPRDPGFYYRYLSRRWTAGVRVTPQRCETCRRDQREHDENGDRIDTAPGHQSSPRWRRNSE